MENTPSAPQPSPRPLKTGTATAPKPIPPLPPKPRRSTILAWVKRHRLLSCLIGYLALLILCHAVDSPYSMGYQFHLGERILQGEQRHRGVDVNRPVDGKAYVLEEGELGMRTFVRAPEVSYRPLPPIVTVASYLYTIAGWLELPHFEGVLAEDVQPTGQERIAEVRSAQYWQEQEDGQPQLSYVELSFEAERAAIPPQAEAWELPAERAAATGDNLGSLGVVEGAEPGFWRSLAASAVEYLVEPVLNVCCTAIDSVASACR